jgi:nicotinamide mononucleotide transporter
MTEISVFGQTLTMTEVIGFITGVAGVWLTIRQNILCFPIGIINVLIYAYMFYSPNVRLYADALLQLIYMILLIYGWISWNKSKNSSEQPIRINRYFSTRLLFISLISWAALGIILSKTTDAALPWIDAGLAIMSLTAQWMIAKKMIENWIVWIVVNSAYIPLYLYKDLKLTALLYAIFLVLAIKGWIEWRRKISIQTIH